jgi:hypothetical protein
MCLGDTAADPAEIVDMLRERNLLGNYVERN